MHGEIGPIQGLPYRRKLFMERYPWTRMAENAPAPWPWPRLLLLSVGSGLAMLGTYVLIFRLLEVGFQLSTNYTREPFVWGGLALIAGIIMLGAPWFPNAPWWRQPEN